MEPTTNDGLAAAIATDAFALDPFPVYRRMLDAEPWLAPSGKLVVAKHATLRSIMVDHETFGQHLAPWPNFHRLDPPDHTRLRRLVSKAFTPKSIRNLQPDIERVSDELLGTARGSFDLIADYAFHLPARIIAQMVGVPAEDATLWHAWLLRMGKFNFLNPMIAHDGPGLQEMIDDAQAANREQAEYFVEIISSRQRGGGDDIVSRLIEAHDEDDRLTDEEVLYVLVLLLQGGLHTTVHQIGNMTRALLEQPEVLNRVRDDPSLVPIAVEEGLRLVGPLQTEIHVARVDTEIEGVSVRTGQQLIIVNAAANRDPRVFEDPDRYDLDRPNVNEHLAFGVGVHHCIGAPLAKAELQVSLRHLSRLPDLRLAAPPERDPFFRIRGHERLSLAGPSGCAGAPQ